MNEYRLTIRVRNNLLLRRLEATPGYISLPKFCAKHELRYVEIAALISMKALPINSRTGMWRDIVERLASILRADPAELFPERQVRGEILATEVSREVGEAELLALSEPQAMALIEDLTPEKIIQDKDLLKKLMAELPEREKQILIAYYGLDDSSGRTLRDVADEFGFSVERCRQMLIKAQRRMRSAAYRKHQLMSGERFHELERPYEGGASDYGWR